MAHPTEGELRELGQEVLDVLVQKTVEEADSVVQARENQIRRDYGNVDEVPAQSGAEMIAEVEAYVRDAYSFVPDMFARFANPRPDDFDGAIERCVTAMLILKPDSLEDFTQGGRAESGDIWSDLSLATEVGTRYPTTVAERINLVGSQIEDWSGTAADAFHGNYMNEFSHSLRLQHKAVQTLAITLEANRKIFENVGVDIVEIGNKTIDALKRVTDKDPDSVALTLTVVASVATVASAATGGAGAPVAAVLWATVAAAGSGAAAYIGAQPDEEHQTEIEGATTQEIMMSMADRISDLYRFIDQEEEKIVRCLESVQDMVAGMRLELEMPLPESYAELDGAPSDEVREEFLHT